MRIARGIIHARERGVEMSEAPKRLWRADWLPGNSMVETNVGSGPWTEYIRADIHQAALDRIAALEAEKATGWAVKVKPLEWEKRWCGHNDDIPSWRATNTGPFFVDFSFAGVRAKDGSRYDRHSDVPAEMVQEKMDMYFAVYVEGVTALLEPADQSAIDAAVAAERERCAKVADTLAASERQQGTRHAVAMGAELCAAAIRTGGEG